MDLTSNCSDDSFLVNVQKYENILASFKKNQITSNELLLSSIPNISRKLNKTEIEISTFINEYQSKTFEKLKKTITSPLIDDDVDTQNVEKLTYFTVGDESIDASLNGGIPLGYLIEVSGKSSCGKTNLLLTLSITIQLPLEFGGLGPSVFDDSTNRDVKTLYIPTESSLPTQRLTQIVENYTELLQTNGIPTERKDCFPKLDNVLTTSNVMSNIEEQDHILRYQLPVMLARDQSIKLLIIDSLTHHLRAQLPWNEQYKYISSLCTYLKKLAKRFNITIIIANQVSDKPVKGLYFGENDILWKLNTEYQLAWMAGWDDIGIIYRQLMRREGIIDQAGESFDRLDYLDNIITNGIKSELNISNNSNRSNNNNSFNNDTRQDLKHILNLEKKRLFDSSYKVKISGISTRPALGLNLLEFVDMRIVLSKEYMPILDENLIDEFSVELGINTSMDNDTTNNSQLLTQTSTGLLETSTQISNEHNKVDQKQLVQSLANNSYLKNYNFQTFRSLKCVFGPLIPAGETRKIEFEIWKGGIRKYNR